MATTPYNKIGSDFDLQRLWTLGLDLIRNVFVKTDFQPSKSAKFQYEVRNSKFTENA